MPDKFVSTVAKFIRNTGHDGDFVVEGFTCMKLELDGRQEIFRAASSYKGNPWLDWCMVEYKQDGTDDDSSNSALSYPAQILGFIRIETKEITSPFSDDQEQMYAVGGFFFLSGLLADTLPRYEQNTPHRRMFWPRWR